MQTANGLPYRRSVRLQPGLYRTGWWYITICSYARRLSFSRIENGEVILSPIGRIIGEEWMAVPVMRPGVTLDEFVIMPNHFHAILKLPEGAVTTEPKVFRRAPGSLGSLVAGFKAAVTSWVRDLYGMATLRVWQKGFHERGIRDQEDLERIREYIRLNPSNWNEDPENPINARDSA